MEPTITMSLKDYEALKEKLVRKEADVAKYARVLQATAKAFPHIDIEIFITRALQDTNGRLQFIR